MLTMWRREGGNQNTNLVTICFGTNIYYIIAKKMLTYNSGFSNLMKIAGAGPVPAAQARAHIIEGPQFGAGYMKEKTIYLLGAKSIPDFPA